MHSKSILSSLPAGISRLSLLAASLALAALVSVILTAFFNGIGSSEAARAEAAKGAAAAEHV